MVMFKFFMTLAFICRFVFLQGDQCKFDHEHVVPDKKKELCKFYLQGYCSKGDHCIYMHNILVLACFDLLRSMLSLS